MTPGETVAACTYKPGWSLRLIHPPHRDIWWPGDGTRPVLSVRYTTPDSSDPAGRVTEIQHQFTVPGFADDWPRWLFARLMDAERHEAMEFFTVAGRKPFYPNHGGSVDTLHADLYELRER